MQLGTLCVWPLLVFPVSLACGAGRARAGGNWGRSCLSQAGRRDRQITACPAFLTSGLWTGLQFPSLLCAWHLWLGGEPRTIQPHSETCCPAQHLSECIRERGRERERTRQLHKGAWTNMAMALVSVRKRKWTPLTCPCSTYWTKRFWCVHRVDFKVTVKKSDGGRSSL